MFDFLPHAFQTDESNRIAHNDNQQRNTIDENEEKERKRHER